MDGACVELQGFPLRITAPAQILTGGYRPHHYKTVNFYRIAAKFARGWLMTRLGEKVEAADLSAYYETLFAEAIGSGIEDFLACVVSNADWFEIDNLDDLDIADYRLKAPEDRLRLLAGRHGGYWRYPIVDHCLLYNFHYPPKKVIDHMAARLDFLIREYPSAQRPIAEFAGQWYGIDPARLIVANGVSELTPLVLAEARRPVVIPTPSFNEHEAMIDPGLVHRHPLRVEEGFRIDSSRLVDTARAVGAASDLVGRLLASEGMLIKDCSGKIIEEASQYLRISSRGRADDTRLCRALARVVAAMRAVPGLTPVG
jgi:hypothetical protein